MPKFDYTQLSHKERMKLIDPLVEALHTLKGKDELKGFLSRLLTPSELIMLGRRLQVAEELIQGASYETVRRNTGVGFSTIRNVDSWLEHAVRDYHDIRAEQRRAEKDAQEERDRLKNWRPSGPLGRNMRIFTFLNDLAVGPVFSVAPPLKSKRKKKRQ